jgi:hypothetical protein
MKPTGVMVDKQTRPITKANATHLKNAVMKVAKKTKKVGAFDPSKSHLTYVKVRLSNGSIKKMWKLVLVNSVRNGK